MPYNKNNKLFYVLISIDLLLFLVLVILQVLYTTNKTSENVANERDVITKFKADQKINPVSEIVETPKLNINYEGDTYDLNFDLDLLWALIQEFDNIGDETHLKDELNITISVFETEEIPKVLPVTYQDAENSPILFGYKWTEDVPEEPNNLAIDLYVLNSVFDKPNEEISQILSKALILSLERHYKIYYGKTIPIREYFSSPKYQDLIIAEPM